MIACLCLQNNDFKGTLENLLKAKEHGYHSVIEENISTVQQWIKSGGQGNGLKFKLKVGHSFEVTRPFKQPVTPGRIVINKEEIRPIVF